MLLTDDTEEAATLAAQLDMYNRERQHIEKAILGEVIELIDSQRGDNGKTADAFVFASSRWHPGVIGIVCSKIIDLYYRPTVLISLKNGVGKGSGRSISDFNLYNGIKSQCTPFLLSYGGHRYAAGISIAEKHIESFAQCFCKAVQEACRASSFIRKTMIDAECTFKEINYELLSQLDILSPFGSHNPEPVLSARNVEVVSIATVGNNHLKMQLKDGGMNYDSIWFSRGRLSSVLSGASVVDVAFTPHVNTWRGSSSIQLKMKDMAFSEKKHPFTAA
jgi:single-stranded-DNA-specific exonuclease